MALVSVTRRWYLREGIPILEIARRTGLPRNTVRKYLTSQELEPAYQQAVPILEMLLKGESSEREVHSINYQMKAAKFPAYRL